jgi:hypothetical protein
LRYTLWPSQPYLQTLPDSYPDGHLQAAEVEPCPSHLAPAHPPGPLQNKKRFFGNVVVVCHRPIVKALKWQVCGWATFATVCADAAASGTARKTYVHDVVEGAATTWPLASQALQLLQPTPDQQQTCTLNTRLFKHELESQQQPLAAF